MVCVRAIFLGVPFFSGRLFLRTPFFEKIVRDSSRLLPISSGESLFRGKGQQLCFWAQSQHQLQVVITPNNSNNTRCTIFVPPRAVRHLAAIGAGIIRRACMRRALRELVEGVPLEQRGELLV